MAAIEMSEVPEEGEVTYSSPDINVLSNTLDSGSLVEVSGYDAFPAISAFDHVSEKNIPNDVPICTAGQYLHLLSLHDIFQLTSDFSCFPHQFRMKEVLHTPAIAVSVHQRPAPLSCDGDTYPLLFHWV